MNKTIQIEIPAPPNGWVYEKRVPEVGELRKAFDGFRWNDMCPRNIGEGASIFTGTYAYRVRDEYAERYGALNLPDGWAWIEHESGVEWSNRPNGLDTIGLSSDPTLRRIIAGKAYKPGEEPK